jgi:glyoxylase-like metal-dependent hydrolase (beta-lactamase superfamily II)
LVVGSVELVPLVDAIGLLGAGHMGLRVESVDEQALLIADAAVHPMLLHEPEAPYVSDADPADCAATRRALLPELVDQHVLVACGDYPAGGIGRVVTRGDCVVWEAAA